MTLIYTDTARHWGSFKSSMYSGRQVFEDASARSTIEPCLVRCQSFFGDVGASFNCLGSPGHPSEAMTLKLKPSCIFVPLCGNLFV